MGARRFRGRFDGGAPRWQGSSLAGGAGPRAGTYTSGFKQTPVWPLWDSVGTFSLSSETLGVYII